MISILNEMKEFTQLKQKSNTIDSSLIIKSNHLISDIERVYEKYFVKIKLIITLL